MSSYFSWNPACILPSSSGCCEQLKPRGETVPGTAQGGLSKHLGPRYGSALSWKLSEEHDSLAGNYFLDCSEDVYNCDG